MIIVITEEKQAGEDYLVHEYGALDMKSSLFLSSLVWAILDEKELSE